MHIKFIGITKCSNKVANILPTGTTDHRGQKVKIQLFSDQCHVAYQVMGLAIAAT